MASLYEGILYLAIIVMHFAFAVLSPITNLDLICTLIDIEFIVYCLNILKHSSTTSKKT